MKKPFLGSSLPAGSYITGSTSSGVLLMINSACAAVFLLLWIKVYSSLASFRLLRIYYH